MCTIFCDFRELVEVAKESLRGFPMTAPSRRQKTVIKIDEIQRIKHKYLSSLNKICNANINIRFKNFSELPEFSPLRSEGDGEGGVKKNRPKPMK